MWDEVGQNWPSKIPSTVGKYGGGSSNRGIQSRKASS